MPPERTNTDDFPIDFFNVTVASGLITTTDGTGFRVSDNDFGDLKPGLRRRVRELQQGQDVHVGGQPADDRDVPGARTDTPGLVNGFGIVFSDIDRDGAASITLYAADGTYLGEYVAPVRSDAAGHSFVGAVYDRPLVSRVEVVSGEAALAAVTDDVTDGGAHDLVITDDLIYGEPQPE